MKGPKSTACLSTTLTAAAETRTSIRTHEGIVTVSREYHQKVPHHYHLHFQIPDHTISPLSSSSITRTRQRDRRQGAGQPAPRGSPLKLQMLLSDGPDHHRDEGPALQLSFPISEQYVVHILFPGNGELRQPADSLQSDDVELFSGGFVD